MNKRAITILLISLLFLSLGASFAYSAPKSPVSSVWSYTVSGKTYSSPIAANKMVYFYSDEGVVYVVDGINGKLKWEYKIEKESKEKFGGCVTVEGGKVYIVLDNGRLIVLNAYTGQKEWLYTEVEGEIYPPVTKFFYYTSPVFSGDSMVYLTAPNGTLHALNQDGKREWVYRPDGSHVSSPPVVFENTVYIGTFDGTVCALNGDTGNPIWTSKLNKLNKGIFFAPFVFDETVFVGSSDKKISALDTKNGELKWNYDIGNEPGSSPTVSGDNVYIGSSNGELFALDASDGELKWFFYVEGFFISSPLVDGTVVYIGSNDGKIYALDAGTGESYWVYDTEGYYVTSVTLAKEMIYVGADIKEKEEAGLKIFAFKRGLSAGVLVRAIGKKGSVSAKETIGQITATADYMLSEFGDKTIDNISTWPFGLTLRFAEQNRTDRIDFAETSGAGKEASKIVLRYTPAASIVGYFCALMMTPIAPIMVLSSVVCCWAILLLFFLYIPLGKDKLAFIIASLTESDAKSHFRKGSYFRALNYTFTSYLSILVSFTAGCLALSISWLLVGYFYPIYEAWLFYFLVALMWFLGLLAGSFARAFGLAYVLQRSNPGSWIANGANECFKLARKTFGRVVLLSGWHVTLLLLSVFCLAFAQVQSSYLALFLGLILTLLAMLTFFADAFIVFKNTSFPKAIIKSIGFSLHNLLKVGFYVIFMGLILVSTTFLVFGSLKLLFGIFISLVVCAVISVYLTNLHGLIFLKTVGRDSHSDQ